MDDLDLNTDGRRIRKDQDIDGTRAPYIWRVRARAVETNENWSAGLLPAEAVCSLADMYLPVREQP